MSNESRVSGYGFAILAALFWGVSGTCAQFLFQHRSIDPGWLVTIRLLISGVLLLAIPAIKDPKSLMSPWKDKKDAFDFLCYKSPKLKTSCEELYSKSYWLLSFHAPLFLI